MAGFVLPILQKFQTLLRANLNAEKDLLDSTVRDIASASIRVNTPLTMPDDDLVLDIFEFGDSAVESEEMNAKVLIPWQVAGRIYAVGEDETDVNNMVDVYTTAMMKAVVKNGSWNLGGTLTSGIMRILTVGSNIGRRDDEGVVLYAKTKTVLFEAEGEYDLSS